MLCAYLTGRRAAAVRRLPMNMVRRLPMNIARCYRVSDS